MTRVLDEDKEEVTTDDGKKYYIFYTVDYDFLTNFALVFDAETQRYVRYPYPRMKLSNNKPERISDEVLQSIINYFKQED